MILVRPAWYGAARCAVEHDIATAFELSCDSPADGVVERAYDVANSLSRHFGKLLALLHAKGVLDDAEVISFISGFELKEGE